MGQDDPYRGDRSPSPEWDEFAESSTTIPVRAVVADWDSCVAMLGTDLERTEAILRAVATVAAEDPEAVVQTADDIAMFVTAEATNVRQQATLALARLAESYPTDVVCAVDDLGVCLANTPDLPSRRRAASVLAHVARESPYAVRQVADALVPRLDDEDEVVRDAAAIALGRIVLARAFPVDLDADVDAVLSSYAGALAGRLQRSITSDQLVESAAEGAELDEVLDELAGFDDLQADLGVVLDAVDTAAVHGGLAPEPLRQRVDTVAGRVLETVAR
ncbi:HEAT repeat domain-containing protein [Haloarchaeobius sp. DFWS5]|uniref:HEAT repeat domain-containing protein n=1 Tax=Haloarchaeobius sp. DFWS5 TaxID=3446114 RepID=UPI003EC0DE69